MLPLLEDCAALAIIALLVLWFVKKLKWGPSSKEAEKAINQAEVVATKEKINRTVGDILNKGGK